jgi:hypothetical protein
LDTDVGYFFEGIGKPDLFRVTQQQAGPGAFGSTL